MCARNNSSPCSRRYFSSHSILLMLTFERKLLKMKVMSTRLYHSPLLRETFEGASFFAFIAHHSPKAGISPSNNGLLLTGTPVSHFAFEKKISKTCISSRDFKYRCARTFSLSEINFMVFVKYLVRPGKVTFWQQLFMISGTISPIYQRIVSMIEPWSKIQTNFVCVKH